jgi:hypothetical protein
MTLTKIATSAAVSIAGRALSAAGTVRIAASATMAVASRLLSAAAPADAESNHSIECPRAQPGGGREDCGIGGGGNSGQVVSSRATIRQQSDCRGSEPRAEYGAEVRCGDDLHGG